MPVSDDRLTVGAFLDRWLTGLPGQVSEKTVDSYADTVRLHITPSLGRKVLRRLTVSDVDQLLAWKRSAGYSANTVRIIRAVLRRALRQAEREGLVSRNAAALSSAPRVRGDEGRALSVDQAKALLDQVRGTRDEPLLTVMLAFGLRRGEALGLRWSALDWDACPGVSRCSHASAWWETRRSASSRFVHRRHDRRITSRKQGVHGVATSTDPSPPTCGWVHWSTSPWAARLAAQPLS
jgi:integrase